MTDGLYWPTSVGLGDGLSPASPSDGSSPANQNDGIYWLSPASLSDGPSRVRLSHFFRWQ